jgi:hypothetical protein
MTKMLTAAGLLAGFIATTAFGGPASVQASPAPDMSGKTYAEVKGQLEQAGYTVVIAATVGDKLPLDKCQVFRQQMKSSPMAGKKNQIDSTRVLVSLRCYPSTSAPESE